MARWLVLLLAGFGAFAAAAAAPPDPAALTRELADRIGREMPGAEIHVTEPLTLEVRAPRSDSPATVYLDRVWAVCRQDDAEACESSKARYIAAILETLADHPPVARTQLREMVRSQDYCTDVGRNFGEASDPLLTRPAPGGLCAVLVADYPNSMALLKRGDLVPLGLVEDDAWRLAERQTLSNLPAPSSLDIRNGFIIIAGLDYIPSLILATDGWRALAQAQGDLVMAIPSDATMFVARAADVDATHVKRVVGQDFASAERGISPHLYRWTATGWTPIP